MKDRDCNPLLTVRILSSINLAIILACGRLYSLASSVRFMMSGRTLAVSLASAAEYSSCTSSAEAIATEDGGRFARSGRDPRRSLGSICVTGRSSGASRRTWSEFFSLCVGVFNMASVSFLPESLSEGRPGARGQLPDRKKR